MISPPGANGATRLTVRAGADVTVAAMNFNTAADASKPNNDSIAANYYASVVDTILALHKDQPIPFFYAPFGEVQYIFPSTESSTATALSASKVAISTFQSQPDDEDGAFAWVDGKTPAHEYGHVLMLRAWDGSTARRRRHHRRVRRDRAFAADCVQGRLGRVHPTRRLHGDARLPAVEL